MIRNYIVGQTESLTFIPIGQATGGNDYIKVDGILTNGFSDLVLYEDQTGASPINLSDYSMTTYDKDWTDDESQTGGSGKTVYSQFQVTNATYVGVDLYATLTNFGTYTDNDAAFNQMGAEIEISSSQTVALSDGAIHTTIIVDTSTADVTVTIDPASFTGQSCDVYCSGSNLAYLKDTDGNLYQGASSLGIPISDGLKCSIRDISGKFVATNEITSDYVSGLYKIEQYSHGRMIMIYTDTFTFSAASSSTKTLTFPVLFSSAPSATSTGGHTTATFTQTSIWQTSTSGCSFRMRNEGGASGTFTSDPSWARMEGDY